MGDTEDESANSSDARPEARLVEHISASEIVDVSAELLKRPFDRLLDDATQEIPVLRTLVAIGRVGREVRDTMFARKLLKFYAELTVAPEKRSHFVDKLRREGKLEKAGETLLEVIDKAVTVEKAGLIGRLYARCIEQAISWSDCARMSEMITFAYLGDLHYFARTEAEAIGDTGDEVEHLLGLGFYRRPAHSFGDGIVWGIRPEMTTYGEHLFAAFAGWHDHL